MTITYRDVLQTSCPTCGIKTTDPCEPDGRLHRARAALAEQVKNITTMMQGEANKVAEIRHRRRPIIEATTGLHPTAWHEGMTNDIPGKGDRSQHPNFVRLRTGSPEAH